MYGDQLTRVAKRLAIFTAVAFIFATSRKFYAHFPRSRYTPCSALEEVIFYKESLLVFQCWLLNTMSFATGTLTVLRDYVAVRILGDTVVCKVLAVQYSRRAKYELCCRIFHDMDHGKRVIDQKSCSKTLFTFSLYGIQANCQNPNKIYSFYILVLVL